MPKCLDKIKIWNPKTVLVSFKLETDLKILESKARNAINTYHVDAVVANELATRRDTVTIFEGGKPGVVLKAKNASEVDNISE